MPSNLSDTKRIWRLVLPIVLLALVVGMTVGEIGHHHANFSRDACPICHVSHQAIAPSVVDAYATALVPSGPGPELQYYSFTSNPADRHIAARAPPAV